MKSSIKIDFNEVMQPIIVINRVKSEDVRDKLIDNFIQILGYSSSWVEVVFVTHTSEKQEIHLYPIAPHRLPTLISEAQHRMNSDTYKAWENNTSKEQSEVIQENNL
jgi:hypothetical protein